LGSTPDTVVWGYLSARTPPVLRIKSGATVRVDTMSHQGLLTKDDPVTFFSAAGIQPEEVLQDATDIYKKVPRGKGLGVHVLTGPIYVEDAAPGDALEVRVRSLEFRVPYGVNNTGPGSGVLPDLVAVPTPRIVKTDPQRKVALLPGGIELPLSPFLGVMSVAPPPNLMSSAQGRREAGVAIWICASSPSGPRFTCPSSMTARCFIPVIHTECRRMERSMEERWSSP